MANTDSLVDLNDGSAVSNSSPQSPIGSALLDTPISLDFDPMSFQFKEESPDISPSEPRGHPDILSPLHIVGDMDDFDPLSPCKPDGLSPSDIHNTINQTLFETFEEADIPPSILHNGSNFFHTTVCEEINDDELGFPTSTSPIIGPPSDLLLSSPDSSECLKLVPETTNGELVQSPVLESPTTTPSLIITDTSIITTTTITSPIPIPTTIITPAIDNSPPDDAEEAEVHDDDNVFQHDECDMSDSNERHGPGSIVSSTHSSRSNSLKSEKIEKKKSTTKKKTYSTSSESSVQDEDHKSPLSPTTKLFKKEEETKTIITRKEIVLEERKSAKYQTTNNKSDAVNGTSKYSSNKRNSFEANDAEDEGDESTEEYENNDVKDPECAVSVAQLKSSFTRSDEEEETQNAPVDEVKVTGKRAKAAAKFTDPNDQQDDDNAGPTEENLCLCKICGKHVYQMEKIKAEKNNFHKTCFRCKECGKSLTVDVYSSHEGEIYCKPHFKLLFQPKARFGEEDGAPRKQRRNEMIIRENVPLELPPDVVRSETKPDYGLDSLPVNLNNLKSRFESAHDEDHHLPSTADYCALQRSESVMARMAKYQSVVSGDLHENGNVSLSESEEDGEVDPSITKETKKHKEKVVFSGMSSLKNQWEAGSVNAAKEERMEEKKEELAKLRQRMCLGRSESMKAVYEKAVEDSTKNTPLRTESICLGRDVYANRIKEKFEKGDVPNDVVEEKLEKARREKEEDLSVFADPGTAGEAKKLFKQIDASIKTQPLTSPVSPIKSPGEKRRFQSNSISDYSAEDVVKCSEPTAKDSIEVDTTDLADRFKFFENYKELPKERKRFQITPPREAQKKEESPGPEIVRDPNVIRSDEIIDDIPNTDTARRMLDKFKALESATDPVAPSGPKPLKRITPPREQTAEDHESSPEPDRDPDIIRGSYKTENDIVVEADKAKSLRYMFENWEADVLRENRKNEDDEDFLPQADTAKNLRAKFEAIKEETLKPLEKPKSKINRFIQDSSGTNVELCNICGKKAYPMEKMETSGMRLHKNCFRCAHCGCMLRLENYTTSGGRLYCTPHFKQLFISRGNYDEGFGREQHKEKWNRNAGYDTNENGSLVEYTNGDVQCVEQTA